MADDLWAAGAAVVLDAPVGDNALLAGHDVRLEDGAEIAGNARVAARSVSLAPGARSRGLGGGWIVADSDGDGRIARAEFSSIR